MNEKGSCRQTSAKSDGNFEAQLDKCIVAYNQNGISITDTFKNICLSDVLSKLKHPAIGPKDGSHLTRELMLDASNNVLPRKKENIADLSRVVFLDCDKSVVENDVEKNGAPPPDLVAKALNNLGLGYILSGTHSHYVGEIGNRYRIIFITDRPYRCDELPNLIDVVVFKINSQLDGYKLALAKENRSWGNAFYIPRRPADSAIENLYFDSMSGALLSVPDHYEQPSKDKIKHKSYKATHKNQISPIDAFNRQNDINQLLLLGGYEFCYQQHDGKSRYLSPHSTSKMPGVIVEDNRFVCYHSSDPFYDDHWHDAFDYMMVTKGLDEKEAVRYAARHTFAPNGQTVDAYNKSFGSYHSNQSDPDKDPDPIPLPDPLPEVMPFDLEVLPEAIREFVADVAERQQCPKDFVAIASLCGLAGVVGRKILISPKQKDDWKVTPTLWGSLIGRPSAMKSPSMKEALRPLWSIEAEAALQYKRDQADYEAEKRLYELDKQSADQDAKALLKANRGRARDRIKETVFTETPPTRKRLIVNDATVEKLGELLGENPNGLLQVRDELSGLMARLNKEEYQQDRAFYLECFDGNGRYICDRIKRGTIDIENCTLSLIGCIQPSKISPIIHNAVKGIGDDGFTQRLQLAVWPDDAKKWKYIDRTPNTVAAQRYGELFHVLHNLNFELHYGESPIIRFNPEAQKLFIEWYEEIQQIARQDDMHPALESHLLKMPKTIATLALILQLVHWVSGMGFNEALNMSPQDKKSFIQCGVSVEATAQALELSDYLKSHAYRLYSAVMLPGIRGAHLALKKLDKLGDVFTAREVKRKGWSGLTDSKMVVEALECLVDYGHLIIHEAELSHAGGRPTIRYRKNKKYIKGGGE